MPTIDDALRLLTDPANVTMDGLRGDVALMRPPATIGELQSMGASPDEARELVRLAAEQLGGQLRVVREPSRSLGRGRWGGHRTRDEIVVPRSALRS